MDVAPRPVLPRLRRADHRVIGVCGGVFRGVPVRRIVTTANRLARGAVPEVHPRPSDRDAVDAASRLDRLQLEIGQMFTWFGQWQLSSLAGTVTGQVDPEHGATRLGVDGDVAAMFVTTIE